MKEHVTHATTASHSRKTRIIYALRFFITFTLSTLTFNVLPCATRSYSSEAEGLTEIRQEALTLHQPEDSSRFILKAREEAMLGAEVSSRITAIPFKLGQAFKKGQVILKLDDTISLAGYQRAVALEKSSEQKFATVSDMFSRKDASVVALEEARSELQAAKATTTVAKKQLDDCKIAAPYAGRIEQVLVNEHELVEKGQPLLKITGDGVLLAGFLLPEKYFPVVKCGQEIKLYLPLLKKELKGKIVRISATIEPSSNTFELYAEIANSEGKLCAGMSGWIEYKQFQPEQTTDAKP